MAGLTEELSESDENYSTGVRSSLASTGTSKFLWFITLSKTELTAELRGHYSEIKFLVPLNEIN